MSWTGTTLAVVWSLALFAFGALIIALWGRRATRAGGAGDLWHAYASTAAIVAAVLVPAGVHPALFAAVAAAAAYRCSIELAAIEGRPARGRVRWILAAIAVLAVALGARHGIRESLALMVSSAVLFVFAAPFYARALARPVGGTPVWVVALAFPVLAALHLAHLIYFPQGFLWVFLLYATVETQDSMAFLFGRMFGRRAFLPRLSPRKTLEGAVAGSVLGIATGTAIAWALLDQPVHVAASLAVLLVAAGLAGDVFTSALKRAAGTKDFPPVHARHGGLLDIYDSTLCAAIALDFAVWVLNLSR